MLRKYFFNVNFSVKVIVVLLLFLANTNFAMANTNQDKHPKHHKNQTHQNHQNNSKHNKSAKNAVSNPNTSKKQSQSSQNINKSQSQQSINQSQNTTFNNSDVSSVSAKISNLLDTHAQEYNVGILIQDAKTGKTIYSLNEDKLFTPASTTKLFPAAAALISLGENFSFATTIYTDANMPNEGAVNNLYVKFTGDPELTNDKFLHLMSTLKSKNVAVIKGNIIIDDTLFSGPDFGSGWSWESNQWFYSPPITAAMINGNSINLRIIPSKELGSNLQAKFIDVDIPDNLKLISTIKAVTYEDSEEKCRLLIDASTSNNYFLSGCWPLNVDPGVLKLSIKNPNSYVKDLILTAIKNENVKFSGKVIFAKTPQNNTLTKIAETRSNTLEKIVRRMLNKSDNVYTESITKTIGAKHFQSGSFKTGVLAIKSVLHNNLGLNVHSVKIEDGSGLSRYNLISPRSFNDLLYKVYHNKDYYDFLHNCMKWPQSSLFLQSRVAALNYHPPVSINAKTGTVSGVSTISGYLTTANKRDVIFTIMINGVRGKQRVAKNLENKIILSLMKL